MGQANKQWTMHHTKIYVMHFVVLEHPCKDTMCELDPVSAISGVENRTNRP